jgi:hypothetical protein
MKIVNHKLDRESRQLYILIIENDVLPLLITTQEVINFEEA